jgi:hypothetical protein
MLEEGAYQCAILPSTPEFLPTRLMAICCLGEAARAVSARVLHL